MIRDDVCYLISEATASHGIFDKPERTERMVYCQVRSVYGSEFWRAKEAGTELSIVFVLADYREYNGERLLRWENGGESRYYRIVRPYVDGNEIQLTCEEALAYDGSPEGGT